MQVIDAVAVLRVADVGRAIDWYHDVLGFEGDPFPDEPPYSFAILRHGSTELMLRRDEHFARDPKWLDWDIYVRLDGSKLRQVYEDVGRRTTITRPLQRMIYGMCEFDVTDPDGHVICVAEDLEDTTGIPDAEED